MIILNKEQITELRQFVIGAANPPVTREELHALCDTAELGLRALEALNPRCWSREMSEAWHRAIPDTQKAFDDLRAIVAEAQPTKYEES